VTLKELNTRVRSGLNWHRNVSIVEAVTDFRIS